MLFDCEFRRKFVTTSTELASNGASKTPVMLIKVPRILDEVAIALSNVSLFLNYIIFVSINNNDE